MRNKFLENCLKEKYIGYTVKYIGNYETYRDVMTQIENKDEMKIFVIDSEIKNIMNIPGEDRFVIIICGSKTEGRRIQFIKEENMSEKNIIKLVSSDGYIRCTLCLEIHDGMINCPACDFTGCKECLDKYVKKIVSENGKNKTISIGCPVCGKEMGKISTIYVSDKLHSELLQADRGV